MKLVRIDELEPDMVVARAITNATGAVLCPEGFTLTESAIDRLRRSGVSAVAIRAEADVDTSKRAAELEARYGDVEDPLLMQIKKAAQLYFEEGG